MSEETVEPQDDLKDDEVSTSAEELADKIMGQAFPQACQTVVNLSVHADNERTRMSASKIVVDYNLKRIADGRKGQGGDFWDDWMKDLVASPKGEEAIKKASKSTDAKT